MPRAYLHYDVFTDTPLLGNQLAVFTDARGLSTELMQAMTREMNFAESTFILPAEASDTDAWMRIFTPHLEMPMAGHPTIGSTFALARSGVLAPGREGFVFGLGVGPVPVSLTWRGDDLRLRICIAGYYSEATDALFPATWERVRWEARGGYANQKADGRGRANAKRECLWFSSHCIDAKTDYGPLFAGLED